MNDASERCARCGTSFVSASDQFCAKCGTSRAKQLRLAVEPPKRKSASVIVMVVAFTVVPLFALCVMSVGRGEVEGSLSATGPRAFAFTPASCESLNEYGGAGANIVGKAANDGGMVAAIDPIKGVQLTIKMPGTCKNSDGTDCATIEVRRESCKVWDVQVEFSGTIVNRVRQYEGHSRLDCTLDDGTHVVADMTFGGC